MDLSTEIQNRSMKCLCGRKATVKFCTVVVKSKIDTWRLGLCVFDDDLTLNDGRPGVMRRVLKRFC